jgi:nicotinamide-nucleotide amidase
MSVGTSLTFDLQPLGALLKQRDLTIAVAESCTAGLLGAALVDLPEASSRFKGGALVYTPEAKKRVLAVPQRIIERHGTVSKEGAVALAEGVARLFATSVAISVTCVAGPGTEEGKPVGLSYIAVRTPFGTEVREYRWQGGRASNRIACVEAALTLAKETLEQESSDR